MSGIILFAYADGFQPTNIIGVILSVGSAVGAAVYKAKFTTSLPTPHNSKYLAGSVEVACWKR